MKTNLTYDECDVLIEALDTWIDKGQSSVLMGDLMAGALGSLDESTGKELEKAQEKKKQKFEEEKRQRKRTAAKLKAKLYDIQEEAEVITDGS